LGNIFLPDPKANKIDQSASEFLVEKVSQDPGEITVLALGPLTNIALVSYTFLSYVLLWSWQLQITIIYIFFNLIVYILLLGNQKRFFSCKQGEENSCM
jgi:hypothetical protein